MTISHQSRTLLEAGGASINTRPTFYCPLRMPHPMDMSGTGAGKPDFTGGVSGGRDPGARNRGALPHTNHNSSQAFLLA
jgi:hypothetical protein